MVLSICRSGNQDGPFFFRVNGSHEERTEALLEDSAAFGIGASVVGVVQFVIGVLSISLLNYAAQQQVKFRSFYFPHVSRTILSNLQTGASCKEINTL